MSNPDAIMMITGFLFILILSILICYLYEKLRGNK